MALRALIAVFVVVVGALGFSVFDQGRQIARLHGELKALRVHVNEVNEASARAIPVAASPTYAPVARRPPSARAAEAPEVAAPAEARVPVTHDEVARIESAVLSLLEADRPELRAKLRAVVEEQQETLEQEQREQRRERWVARREARLLEVGEAIGLSAEQQKAILHVMLATRDQIGDMMQSADTAEAFNASRDKARALREQADAQIRALLKPEQYEAFRARMGDDDDDRRRGPGSPREP